MGGMTGFKRLMPVDEALSLIHEAGIPALGKETIPTAASLGRVLEEDLVSRLDVPPFDRTAVDGYAIGSRESFSASRKNPAVFRLKGTIEAGQWQDGGPFIGPGEAYEVYTGAPVPRGADAVVMAEDAERVGGIVEVYRPVAKMSNVSPRGEDIRAGEVLLPRGTLVRPWHIGAMASVGIGAVVVRRRARVGIFSTGSELVDLDVGRGKAGAIIDSTRPMIKASLEDLGCLVLDGGIVEDRLESIAGRIKKVCGGSDAAISIGGTSVGRKDLVPDSLEKTGLGRLIFHGLAIKPGKPTGYALVGRKPLFLLPGYPVSALVGFEAVVEPLLCSMMGRSLPERPVVKARISRRVPTTPGIRHYLRVQLRAGDGGLVAEPITITGSGLLSSVTRADGIVVIGEDLEGLEEGDEVEVGLLLGDGHA